MSIKEYILVFDIGSGTARVALFDPLGNLVGALSQARRYTPVDSADTFIIVFDPHHLWSQLCGLTRDLLDKTGVASSSIRAVTATGQRHSCVFIGAKGEVVCASPNQDARGFFAQELIEKQLGNEIYAITGQWPPILSSLARFLWYRQEEPETCHRIKKILMLNDWVLYKLCGELVSEPTASSSSMILDIGRRQWSSKVIECFSLDPSLLPPLADAGHTIGGLTASASQECGLLEHTPVVISGGDTHCALLAAGAAGAGDIGLIAGTTTPVCCIVDDALIDPEQRIWTTCHLLPGQWILDSNAQWTGAVYQWLHDFVKEEFVGMLPGQSCFDIMETRARTAPPGSNDTYAFLGSVIMDVRNFFVLRPGLFLFPPPTHPMIEKPTTLGDMIRATLENIVYAIQGNMSHLARIYTKALLPPTLYLTGGLSHSRLFTEILADCTGIPVAVSRFREGTALGAALCASVGVGFYPDLLEAARNMVQIEERIEPVPEHTTLYKRSYERWKDLYQVIPDL